MTTSDHGPRHVREDERRVPALEPRFVGAVGRAEVRRVVTSEPHLSLSGPPCEAPSDLDAGSKVHLDAASTIDVGPLNSVRAVIDFLREIGGSDEIRLLEMSGDYRLGVKLAIRHLRTSKLRKTLSRMHSVRKVTRRGTDFTVELNLD